MPPVVPRLWTKYRRLECLALGWEVPAFGSGDVQVVDVIRVDVVMSGLIRFDRLLNSSGKREATKQKCLTLQSRIQLSAILNIDRLISLLRYFAK
jgi:hypothetical protein